MHLGAEQKLVSEEFDEARVEQDARAERVKDARDQGRLRRTRVVRRADAEAHSDADRRRDAVEEGAEVGHIVVFGG